MPDRFALDPALVARALHMVVDRAREQGLHGQIVVFGGAALAQHYPNDPDVRTTEDIDALYPRSDAFQAIIDEVGVQLGLRPRWFNANVKPLVARVPPPAEPSALSLDVAPVEDLIAMKMAAGRPQDQYDLAILCRHAGVRDPSTLVDITFSVYGEDSITLGSDREDLLLFARSVIRETNRRYPI